MLLSRRMKVTVVLDDEEQDVVVDVGYRYTAGSYGRVERGSGLQLEPDEPDDIEITTVELGDRDITAAFSADDLVWMTNKISDNSHGCA